MRFLHSDVDFSFGFWLDCLTRLSLTNTYTVSESLDTIQRVLDYLLLVSVLDELNNFVEYIFVCLGSRCTGNAHDELHRAVVQVVAENPRSFYRDSAQSNERKVNIIYN